MRLPAGRALCAWGLLAVAAAGPAASPSAAGPAAPDRARAPGPGGRETGPVLSLTLEQAVRLALRRNPTLEETRAAILRADAAVAEARAMQLPRLDAAARFALQGPIPSFTLTLPPSRPGEPPQTREITFGKTFTRNYSLQASVDPDPFGRLRAGRRAAAGQANVSRGAYFAAQNELVFSAQNLYLAALRARELIGVQQEALDASSEQLRVADAQFRAGTAPEFDVLRARVQVANVRQNLVSAAASFRRAAASLSELLSVDPAARLELAPVAVPPESAEVAGAAARQALEPSPGSPAAEPVPASLEAALAEAFSRRPEVYRAEWLRRSALARAEFERRGRLPSLSLAATGFYDPDMTGFAAVERSWSIVANVAIPIWDAGLARARARQARADADAAAAQLDAARDGIAEEVKRSLIDLDDAVARRRAAAANVLEAREALRIARVRYGAGLSANVEVTDAEAALTLARANEVNAGYDYLAALAALNRALGRYAGDTLARLSK